jgi:hypothetical protein
MRLALGASLLRGSLCVFDEFAQSFAERNGQLIGDLHPHADLAQLDPARTSTANLDTQRSVTSLGPRLAVDREAVRVK